MIRDIPTLPKGMNASELPPDLRAMTKADKEMPCGVFLETTRGAIKWAETLKSGDARAAFLVKVAHEATPMLLESMALFEELQEACERVMGPSSEGGNNEK